MPYIKLPTYILDTLQDAILTAKETQIKTHGENAEHRLSYKRLEEARIFLDTAIVWTEVRNTLIGEKQPCSD